MDDPGDGYDGYYQARLWESLPAIYHVLDAATFADLDTASLPAPARCANWSTGSGRRSPWSAGASTACGPTSRSRRVPTG